MYSFCVEGAPKPSSAYEWFTYKGRKPVKLMYRGKEVKVETGQKFGVRKSRSGKDIRLIFPSAEGRVFTLTLKQAQDLAKGV